MSKTTEPSKPAGPCPHCGENHPPFHSLCAKSAEWPERKPAGWAVRAARLVRSCKMAICSDSQPCSYCEIDAGLIVAESPVAEPEATQQTFTLEPCVLKSLAWAKGGTLF